MASPVSARVTPPKFPTSSMRFAGILPQPEWRPAAAVSRVTWKISLSVKVVCRHCAMSGCGSKAMTRPWSPTTLASGSTVALRLAPTSMTVSPHETYRRIKRISAIPL